MDIPSPFGTDAADFDGYDEFVPDHLPEPGPFLTDATVLTGADHVAFHGTARDIFEERSVYDATFGYNLARLDQDARHPDAGYRYAVEDEDVLRAEFTPTTAFCPQTDTLCIGSFRAWNGLADRHDYELVRVRVAPMHQRARQINGRLADLERRQDAPLGDGASRGREPATAAGGDAGSGSAAEADRGRPSGAAKGPDSPDGRGSGPSSPF